MRANARVLGPTQTSTPWPRAAKTVAPPRVESRPFLRRSAADVVGAASSAIVSTLFAVFSLELWRANFRVPLYYANEGLLMLTLVKDLLADGWWLSNSALGAPYGQELYDFPLAAGNLLHVLALDTLGFAIKDPATTMNVYYVLSFPVVALSAYFVLRRLEVSVLVASVCAIVFSTLPYHFGRNEDHLFLAMYFTVPIACYLVVLAFAGRRFFPSPANWRRNPRSLLPLAGVVAACIAIGSASTYYAAFAALLLLAGGLVSAVAHPRLGSLPHATLAFLLVVATVAACLSPVFVYRLEHGTNDAVAVRSPKETERLSLKLSELVLPVRGHRLAPLADLRERYETETLLPSESNQALGVAGTIGLFSLLVVGIAAAVGRRWQEGPTRILPSVAAATLVALLIATTGGLSTIVSYAGITQLRGWNRMSIFVGFFALLSLAILLDAARRRWGSSARSRRLLAAAVLSIPALALLDQTNSSLVPPHGAFQSAWASDSAFVRSIERELPGNASVFQLPYVSFPEEARPPATTGAYDELVGFLHSDRLRWSFGAMRGRNADWASALAQKPPDAVAMAAVAAGFSGIQVDTLGYDDAGANVLAALGMIAVPTYSLNHRLAFVDLRAYGQRLRKTLTPGQLYALQSLTLRPVRSLWGSSFWPAESDGGHEWRWTRTPEALIGLVNPTRLARTVDVELTLGSGVSHPSQATVAWPDGLQTLVELSSGGVTVHRRLEIPPGQSTIRLSTNAEEAARSLADDRTHLYLRVTDARLRDVTFAAAFPETSPAVSLFDVAPRSTG